MSKNQMNDFFIVDVGLNLSVNMEKELNIVR